MSWLCNTSLSKGRCRITPELKNESSYGRVPKIYKRGAIHAAPWKRGWILFGKEDSNGGRKGIKETKAWELRKAQYTQEKTISQL